MKYSKEEDAFIWLAIDLSNSLSSTVSLRIPLCIESALIGERCVALYGS